MKPEYSDQPQPRDRAAFRPAAASKLRAAYCLIGFLINLAVAGGRGQTATEAFEFREPRAARYRLEIPGAALAGPAARAWVRGWPASGGTNPVWFGSRVVLGVRDPAGLPALLSLSALRLDRTLRTNLFVLQAPDALTAARAAQTLALHPGVEASHPVRRRPLRLHGAYSRAPNDPLFVEQWHLENRDPTTGTPTGADLNARAAWPFSLGSGVVVAVADNGVELSHPDLAANSTNGLHRNFLNGSDNGNPVSSSQSHGTAVAGLLGAVAGNRRGVSGIAPGARLASWVIFDSGDNLADEEQVMEAFQYQSNRVAVQNHSWGNASVEQLELSALESSGIDNAVRHGRDGRGVVLVRAAGNERVQLNDVNDDGFAQDPRNIAVGAVRANGRATSYTTPGAAVLVAALSGDDDVSLPNDTTTNYPSLTTTDRQGGLGYNTDVGGGRADYAYGATGFSGTSGSAPQISGVCAMILAVNPALTWRDVQQVLLLAARHTDPADPGLEYNGAGLRFSHSTGFGVPDAAEALRLAVAWSNRPPAVSVTVTNAALQGIPDDNLRVEVSGTRVPLTLESIPAYPSDTIQPDDPTPRLPLVDVGAALEPISVNLTNRGALIRRGTNYFVEKIAHAANAGASFAVIFNHQGTTDRLYMNGGDIQFSRIPAVFIDRDRGEALSAFVRQNADVKARLHYNATPWTFQVTNTLLCEYVQVRARFAHPRRADLRLTLVSPSGSRSVLHRFNNDTNSELGDWVFYSRLHWGECSAGEWRAEVTDQRPGLVGRVNGFELTISGIPIEDTDRDGLDDRWERAAFGGLVLGPAADPDRDGYSNAREQALGWDPATADRPLELNLSRWSDTVVRLTWPSTPTARYDVLEAADPAQTFTVRTNLAGSFPETECLLPAREAFEGFFQVRRALP